MSPRHVGGQRRGHRVGTLAPSERFGLVRADEAGGIRTTRQFAPDQIQPASLDLRLGAIAYRVRASFLAGPGTTVAERLDILKLHEIALEDGEAVVIETGAEKKPRAKARQA